MPLAAIIAESMPPSVASMTTQDTTLTRGFRKVFECEAIRTTIDHIRAGDTWYPLRSPRGAKFIPGVGEFLVDGFSPTFIGRGTTSDLALEDWQLQVHSAFQDLVFKRPFEMTERDRRTWSVLSSQIDVTVYRNRTPIRVRQFGRIRRARPYPSEIQWENGKCESIEIKQVASPNFISFKPGQPFEAIVLRDPVTFRLLRIVDIERRSEPTRFTPSEEAELLESIGSKRTLENVEWE